MLLYLFSLTRDASGRFTGRRTGGRAYLLADPAPESTTRANAARSVEYKLDGLVRDEEKIFRAMDAEETGRYLPFGYLRVCPAPTRRTSGPTRQAQPHPTASGRPCDPDGRTALRRADRRRAAGQGRSSCRWCDYGFICCHESGIGERALDAPAKPF